MEMKATELTTEAQRNMGQRAMRFVFRDGDDEHELLILSSRREEVSLDGESPRYEATGNVADNSMMNAHLPCVMMEFGKARFSTAI